MAVAGKMAGGGRTDSWDATKPSAGALNNIGSSCGFSLRREGIEYEQLSLSRKRSNKDRYGSGKDENLSK